MVDQETATELQQIVAELTTLLARLDACGQQVPAVPLQMTIDAIRSNGKFDEPEFAPAS